MTSRLLAVQYIVIHIHDSLQAKKKLAKMQIDLTRCRSLSLTFRRHTIKPLQSILEPKDWEKVLQYKMKHNLKIKIMQ